MINNFNNIFQDHLPVSPWHELALKKLPGINPLKREDWIIIDSAFDQQMQYVDYWQRMAETEFGTLSLPNSTQVVRSRV